MEKAWNKKGKKGREGEEEGVIYKVNCKDCDKVYIGETNFAIEKRIKQHKKNVEFGRVENNVIARHVKEKEHQIEWEKAVVLEKEKRMFPRKIIEGAYIRRNKQRCLNLNDGLGVSMVYGGGERAWLRRGEVTI